MNDREEYLADLLIQAPWIHDRLIELGGLGPTPGSTALTDLSLPRGELIRSGAIASINSSIDHFMSWAGLFVRAGLLPSFAPYTLMRSTVEAAATARWLIDPGVDARERIARGMGHQLADLTERRKIERMHRPATGIEIPNVHPETKVADVRIAELEADARAAGITPRRVNHTDLAARFGIGDFAYRILCAFAHAGLAIPFAASRRSEPWEPDAGGLRAVQLTADLEGAITMTEASLRIVKKALIEVYAYQGHQVDATPPPAGSGAAA